MKTEEELCEESWVPFKRDPELKMMQRGDFNAFVGVRTK